MLHLSPKPSACAMSHDCPDLNVKLSEEAGFGTTASRCPVCSDSRPMAHSLRAFSYIVIFWKAEASLSCCVTSSLTSVVTGSALWHCLRA